MSNGDNQYKQKIMKGKTLCYKQKNSKEILTNAFSSYYKTE